MEFKKVIIVILSLVFTFNIFKQSLPRVSPGATEKNTKSTIESASSKQKEYLLLRNKEKQDSIVNRLNLYIKGVIIASLSALVYFTVTILYFKTFHFDLRERIREMLVLLYHGSKFKVRSFFSY